jgi:26S proteasome non-ATPase regulatory subunit 10
MDRAGSLLAAETSRAEPNCSPLSSLGNTALHLAMESGHGEAAITLIEAGADRERVTIGLFGRKMVI